MNKAKLKTYAPQARKDFIAAVTQRANLLGLSESAGVFAALPAERRGDVVLIAGREWPARVAEQRERLVRRIQRDGFGYTMEAVAYTWFNRFAALRYMELHDYLGHGHRVLSSATAGGLPDILAHAADLAASRELPGLDAAHIAELKLAGNKDGELYRLLLVAQCNALSTAMPFLFERIDDETELLLPDNLLRTDSVIAKLVAEIPEEDWAEVEIIGWLYQFYISEKKDQVIGKVVKSEDIPAATQLFTPNWIVQYLVQNSVGRLWLMANPASTLKREWPYYIEPAEQAPEVNAQLDALIQTRMAEDGGSLNPESITVLDPACGSGHILVEAYALLKGIYLERGYRLRDIPRLILEKNLYGLDIDDRATQLAGFALLMKARADDRRLFNDPPRLNVLSLQESKGLDLDELATHLAPFDVQRGTVKALLDTFEHAKTFGSLIQIPDELNAQLPAVVEALVKESETGDLYAQAAAQDLMPLVEQTRVLGRKYDAVVANPPYMGGKAINETLKEFAQELYSTTKSDAFAMFMSRAFWFAKRNGFVSMVTMQSWMFLSSFEDFRLEILGRSSVQNMFHLPYEGKSPTAMGISFGVVAFTFLNNKVEKIVANFCYANHEGLTYDGVPKFFPPRNGRSGYSIGDDFHKLPGSPISYWASEHVRNIFSNSNRLGDRFFSEGPCKTGNDSLYMRLWWEVRRRDIDTGGTWCLCSKGGGFRKFFGNVENVIRWTDSARSHYKKDKISRISPQYVWERNGITWTIVTSKATSSFRALPSGVKYNSVSPTIFPKSDSEEELMTALSFMNSCVADHLVGCLNPTLAMNVENVLSLPVSVDTPENVEGSRALLEIYQADWSAAETAIAFESNGLLSGTNQVIANDWVTRRDALENEVNRALALEEENNRIFIEAYGLQDELDPEVPAEQVVLARADRESDCSSLISYAMGCMMGRYSLDEPGLIYAHAGNVGFDATRYQTFPADADGIVPITDELWFEDDAAIRVREFLRAVWGPDTLDENMAWFAESLGRKASETPDETIRRYLADKFFNDHLQTYKKRPIYWLFSSGKQGAFQALVYLHRYFDGTLARLRAEYVVPLTGKMQARIEMLEKDATAAPSTAARNKLNKQIEKLRKKHVELLAYDEKLRHYADMRISLDLDDGVKVNYGKFGDLLAEVKAVTGGAADE
ncbi:MAG TPA: BREX-1 system adenine-specific DNA-methyltransferase PglX [Rhodocyclaceae bacterium]|nr:BREX-1 system adenine-specific DNA-methyltransferase PglX [Rhodocyclaceae bacterium]